MAGILCFSGVRVIYLKKLPEYENFDLGFQTMMFKKLK